MSDQLPNELGLDSSPIHRRIRRWTLILILAGVAWRTIRYLLCFPIWGDEGFVTVNLLLRDFRGMCRTLEYDEFVPLLFMWVELAAVRLLGFSEYVVRLNAYVCGIAGLLLFWRFCRLTMNELAAMLATGILAVAYYPVRHAVEVKPYSGDLLAAVVFLNLAWEVHRHPSSWWRWLLLWTAVVVGIWWSYPATFVAGGVAIFLLVDLRWYSSRKLAAKVGVYAVLLAASFLAMYFSYGRPQRGAGDWIVTQVPTFRTAFPPIGQPWRIPQWLIGVHTGNMLAYPVGSKGGGSTLTFVLVLVGSVVAWRRQRPLLIGFLACLGANLLAASIQAYPYGSTARVALYAAPIFCWLAGTGLAAILTRWLSGHPESRVVGAVVVVLLLIGLGGIARDVVQPYKTTADFECRQVLREAASQTRPGDRWIVFNADRDCAYAPFIGQAAGFGARFRWYVSILAPSPPAWAPEPDKVAPLRDGRTLLLVHEFADQCPERMLSAYVESLQGRLGPPATAVYQVAKNEQIRLLWFGGQHADATGQRGVLLAEGSTPR